MVLLAAIVLAVTAACGEPTDPGRTDELLPESMVQFDAVIVDVLASKRFAARVEVIDAPPGG